MLWVLMILTQCSIILSRYNYVFVSSLDENKNPQQQSIFADSAIGASIIQQDTERYEDGLIDQPTAATD